MIFYVPFFLLSCFGLYYSGELVVGALMRVAKFLGWKEFVVAFIVMSFASSLPNLLVGIFSFFIEFLYCHLVMLLEGMWLI